MASLIGKADSTLVQGSFREAAANVPLDRGPIYAAQIENVKTFQGIVQKAFDTQFADYVNTNDELKTASKEIMSSIESGTYSDDEGVQLYMDSINNLKSRLKQVPVGKKGDLDRAKIRGELGRMKNSAKNAEEVLSRIYTMVNNDQHNVAGTGEMLPLFRAISKGEAKREIINGELVYSITTPDGELKLNHNQLEEKLVLKDYKAEADFYKIKTSFVEQGKIAGNTFDPVSTAALFENVMTTPNAYAHIINVNHGAKQSFAEAFKGKDVEVMAELSTILKDYGGDIDKDGKPDEITQQNAAKFIDALTNIHSKNFNLHAAKKIASMYYAEKLALPEYDRGQGILNAATAKQKDSFNTLSFAQQKEVQKAKMIDTILLDSDVGNKNSLLQMNKLIGGTANRYKIDIDGDDYVIIERKGKTESDLERFSTKDLKALQTYLYNYSNTSPTLGQNMQFLDQDFIFGVSNPYQFKTSKGTGKYD